MTVNCTDLCTYLRNVPALIRLLVYIYSITFQEYNSLLSESILFYSFSRGGEIRISTHMRSTGGILAEQRISNFEGMGAL